MAFCLFLTTLRKSSDSECFAFQVQEQMESGQNFERLPELHALACGLKVFMRIYTGTLLTFIWDKFGFEIE